MRLENPSKFTNNCILMAFTAMRVPLALRRGLFYLLPLAILIVAVVARITASDLLERLSLFCFDIHQKADPREAGDAPIRIVDIDDNSLKEIGSMATAAHHGRATRRPVAGW
jgi:CHASE2 domain-containing sensor protein